MQSWVSLGIRGGRIPPNWDGEQGLLRTPLYEAVEKANSLDTATFAEMSFQFPLALKCVYFNWNSNSISMESSFLRKRRKKLVVKLYRTRFYMYQLFHKKLDFAGNITDLHRSSLSFFPALPYPPVHTPPMLVWYLKIPIATSAHGHGAGTVCNCSREQARPGSLLEINYSFLPQICMNPNLSHHV